MKKSILGMVRIPCPTLIADIRESDFLRTWSASTRTKINKAEGDDLHLVRDNELLPGILDVFNQTARAKGLRGHLPEDFYSRPWIFCSAVMLGDQIIAGHVWAIDEEAKRCLLLVNASAHRDESLDPSLTGRAHYYLLWQDGLYLRNHGIDCLDLHGFDPESDDASLQGVYTWKAATHGTKEELFHYYPFWFYWLRKLREKWKR